MKNGNTTGIRGPEILLVDDDPDDVDLALHALRNANVKVTIQTVRDGQEALDYLFREGLFVRRADSDPKVVLLDLKLPKVDGLEVLRRLKRDSRFHRMPVVMLTSSREERDLVASYELGVNSYLVKPVDFQKFDEAVRAAGLYWTGINEPPTLAG